MITFSYNQEFERRMLFGRALNFWFLDLYSLNEAKRILKALEQLEHRKTTTGDPDQGATRRLFWERLWDAAYMLVGDVEMRVNMMLTDREAVGNVKIKRQLRALDDHFYGHAENRIVSTRRNSLHVYWQVLGASRTARWRASLKQLREGHLSIPQALRSNPLIRYVLRDGLLLSGMADQLDPRWLHKLEQSPEILAEVVEAARSDDSIAEKRGRVAYPELTAFVFKIITAAESATGQRITATDHKDRRSKTKGISRQTSPGVKLVYACVKPLYPPATLESCGGLIRRARALQ